MSRKIKIGKTSSLKKLLWENFFFFLRNALAHQSTKVIGSPFNDLLEMDFTLFGWANIEKHLEMVENETILEGTYTAESNLWRFKSKKRLFQRRRFSKIHQGKQLHL